MKPTSNITLSEEIREAFQLHHRSLASPSFQLIALHRIKQRAKNLPRPLAVPTRAMLHAAWVALRNLYGTSLPTPVVLGRRFKLVHHTGVVIHPQTRFGDDCIVRQNVTVGGGRTYDEYPTIGNRVSLGAGCVVVGRITVGDDVTIGPNAVVMTDIPAGATVVAPASRVIGAPLRQKKAS